MSLTLAILSYLLIFLNLWALAHRDLKEYILPDLLNLALGLSFLGFHISTQWKVVAPLEAVWGALVGGGLLMIIRTFANKFYNADSLGLGDVKLMSVAGFGLGHPAVLMALIVGAGVGMLHGLCIAHVERSTYQRKMPLGLVNVPAGLGLTIGIALVMLYHFGFQWVTTE